MTVEAAEQPASVAPLEPREAKLSRKNRSTDAVHARLRCLMKQCRTDVKAIEADVEQENQAHTEFEEHCHQNPKFKFQSKFQACIKEHGVWPYPAFDKNARWNREKPRAQNAVDNQNKKVDFGSWYNHKYGDYLHL